jgi:hypothetical protein
VASPEHWDESALAKPETHDVLDRLLDELGVGIRFVRRDLIEWREVRAAVAVVFNEPPRDLWREAFTQYPHTPRASQFMEFMGGQIRVRARFAPTDEDRTEVEHERTKERALADAYEEDRAAGHSFKKIASDGFERMVEWKLGPLVASEAFLADFGARVDALVGESVEGVPSMAPGSNVGRYLARKITFDRVAALVEKHPDLPLRLDDLKVELRKMPTFWYPPLLRAALTCVPNRKPRPSDGYDIEHLSRGLSRCDIVTADRAMVGLAHQHGLVPGDCMLLEYSDVAGLVDAVKSV